MPDREKPKTMKDTVDRIWTVVEGTNGHGLKQAVEDNRQDIAQIKIDVGELKEGMAFVRGNIEGHMNTGSTEPRDHKPSTKAITLRRVAEIAVGTTVAACVLGLFVLLFLGRLTADDIAGILSAWRGTP